MGSGLSQLFQVEEVRRRRVDHGFPSAATPQPRRGHHEIHEKHESFAGIERSDSGEAFVFFVYFVVYLPSVAVEDRSRTSVVLPLSWLRLCRPGDSSRTQSKTAETTRPVEDDPDYEGDDDRRPRFWDRLSSWSGSSSPPPPWRLQKLAQPWICCYNLGYRDFHTLFCG